MQLFYSIISFFEEEGWSVVGWNVSIVSNVHDEIEILKSQLIDFDFDQRVYAIFSPNVSFIENVKQ